jgi:hypothetical protein
MLSVSVSLCPIIEILSRLRGFPRNLSDLCAIGAHLTMQYLVSYDQYRELGGRTNI